MFDSQVHSSNDRATIVEQVTLQGNHLHSIRTYTTDNHYCTLDMDRQPDGSYVGTGTCPGGPSGWYVKIDARVSNPDGRVVTIVERVTITGRHLHSERVQTSDNTHCTLDGDLLNDNRTYQGTAQCSNGPSSWGFEIKRP